MDDGIRLDDEEFERLEELRRHGDRRHGNDDDYYTLPPRRTGMLHEWTSWRTKVNDLLCDAISENPNPDKLKKRDILTSPTETKTPKFFRGEMSVNGQRIKDQYGGPVIEEDDDIETRQEKKMMEANFYLFGIPRISVRHSLGKHSNTAGDQADLRPKSSSKSERAESLKSSIPETYERRRNQDVYSASNKEPGKGLVRRWSVADERPRLTYNPRSFSMYDISNTPVSRNVDSAYMHADHGRFVYVSSAANTHYKKHTHRKGRTELVMRDDRFS